MGGDFQNLLTCLYALFTKIELGSRMGEEFEIKLYPGWGIQIFLWIHPGDFTSFEGVGKI